MRYSVEIDTSELEACGRHIAQEIWRGVRDAVVAACREAPAEALAVRQWKDRSGAAKAATRGFVTSMDDAGASGIVESAVHYASYLDAGTAPHDIWPKVGEGMVGPMRRGQSRRDKYDIGTHRVALRWFDSGGGVHFARMVHHPGTTGDAYMGRAYLKAERVMEREIVSSIGRAQRWADS